jgi:hypothetical protein
MHMLQYIFTRQVADFLNYSKKDSLLILYIYIMPLNVCVKCKDYNDNIEKATACEILNEKLREVDPATNRWFCCQKFNITV